MKTVVTGGTGFIGSHLVKRLLDVGREVIVASDMSRLGTGNLTNLGIKAECRNVDLRDYDQALEVLDGAQTVFHLAARVGSLQYLHATEMAEVNALQANLTIDANVFRACLEKGVGRLVYASSCAVYPMDNQFAPGAVFPESCLELNRQDFLGPQVSESGQRIINPDGGYGWAKLMGEIELGWIRNIDTGIARLFNIYGQNEPLGEKAHVICDLIIKAIRYPEDDFVVYGDGKQSRDFLHVSDCVNALLKLEERATSPPVTTNIGSGVPVSIGTIAEKVAKLSGKDIEIVYDLTKPMGPLSRTADISKAKSLLGWAPGIDLDDGLKRTYEWVDEMLKGQSGA